MSTTIPMAKPQNRCITEEIEPIARASKYNVYRVVFLLTLSIDNPSDIFFHNVLPIKRNTNALCFIIQTNF